MGSSGKHIHWAKLGLEPRTNNFEYSTWPIMQPDRLSEVGWTSQIMLHLLITDCAVTGHFSTAVDLNTTGSQRWRFSFFRRLLMPQALLCGHLSSCLGTTPISPWFFSIIFELYCVCIEQKLVFGMLFLDYGNAFRNIDRLVLLNVLPESGVDHALNSLVRDYFSLTGLSWYPWIHQWSLPCLILLISCRKVSSNVTSFPWT